VGDSKHYRTSRSSRNHRGGPDSIPGQSMWDLCVCWNTLFLKYFDLSLSVAIPPLLNVHSFISGARGMGLEGLSFTARQGYKQEIKTGVLSFVQLHVVLTSDL